VAVEIISVAKIATVCQMGITPYAANVIYFFAKITTYDSFVIPLGIEVESKCLPSIIKPGTDLRK